VALNESVEGGGRVEVTVQVSRVQSAREPPSTTALSPPIWALFGLAYRPHIINIIIVNLNLSDYTASHLP
jgi:hypothetical protein